MKYTLTDITSQNLNGVLFPQDVALFWNEACLFEQVTYSTLTLETYLIFKKVA
jgi:hypothetical protein